MAKLSRWKTREPVHYMRKVRFLGGGMKYLALIGACISTWAALAPAEAQVPPPPPGIGPRYHPAPTGDSAFDAFNRGRAALAAQDYDGAIAEESEALRIRPAYPDAAMIRALAWGAKGDNDRAISDYDKIIILQPGNYVAHLNRGLHEYYEGIIDLAIADYDHAISILPDSHGFSLRADAWLVKGDLDRALDDLDHGIALTPQDVWLLSKRGLVHLRRGDWALAVSDCDEALRTGPPVANTLYVRGLAKLRLGRASAGQADLAAAEAMTPGISKYWAKWQLAH